MHGMNYIGRVLSNFKDFYNDINAATLTGAIDVVVVEQPDGSYNCSPFHVRFGKLGVLRSKEKVVDIEINGEPQDIHMKLGESGEAFFVEELEGSDTDEIPDHLATSPIPVSEFEKLYTTQSRRRNSLDLSDPIKPLENQLNEYTKRRNTADSESQSSAKIRERDFLERQIVLGNIDIGETSCEDLTLSVQTATNKLSSEDVSKSADYSEPIFHMDSLDNDNSKSESCKPKVAEVVASPSAEEPQTESKSSKKRRRKKSLLKKKMTHRKSASASEISVAEISEALQDSMNDVRNSDTDRSSLESNTSEPELREMQKYDGDSIMTTSINRKLGMDPDFHFFSDTELTTSNVDSRSNSPVHIESVQSDTEFEVKKSKEEESEDKGQSWAWGEFPSVSQTNAPATDASLNMSGQDQHNSMLASMFSFMKQSKHRRLSGTEGVYLADISSGSVDPEVAALYFSGTTKKEQATDPDMDCESGNGPSLTQSPNSAEGCKSIDSDFEENNKGAQTYMHDISLSLCGWDPEPTEESFSRHSVVFTDLCNNPALLESPNLVVRINEKYYNWKVASVIISSLMIYQRPLPQSTVDQLCSMHMPATASSIRDDPKQPESRYFWFSWRRNKTSRETTPAPELTEAGVKEVLASPPKISEEPEIIIATQIENNKTDIDKSLESTIEEQTPQTPSSSDKFRKTLRLSSKQISSLNLRDGMNEVQFSVTTAYQGTTRCKCHLYKWKWDDKIVISDIDGTITKSDVLGHILPIVGKDWAQSGVAQLFNKIKDNGYKLLYLSARAIGQARITRDYLRSIKQGDLSMPDGPLLLNPTSLITAFHREVIEKKPEQFKISCMSDIRALFPPDSNPFYAGYGNRINDVYAYRAVGIPIVRIFTINPKGELKHELTQTFQSSYSNMSYIVDHLFPPIREAANEYSQFVYWREPVAPLEDVFILQ